jgi:hypothetical protein
MKSPNPMAGVDLVLELGANPEPPDRGMDFHPGDRDRGSFCGDAA